MKKLLAISIVLALTVWNCGGDNNGATNSDSKNATRAKMAEKLGLTMFEMDNGIGPIKEKLNIPDQIDQIMAKSGEETFKQKCAQCHKLDERYTGPALRQVTERRSHEYIMNMILNPQEMTQKHPEARKLLAQFATQMTFQNVTREDARNILEFLRKADK